jgi:hypothetical protein
MPGKLEECGASRPRQPRGRVSLDGLDQCHSRRQSTVAPASSVDTALQRQIPGTSQKVDRSFDQGPRAVDFPAAVSGTAEGGAGAFSIFLVSQTAQRRSSCVLPSFPCQLWIERPFATVAEHWADASHHCIVDRTGSGKSARSGENLGFPPLSGLFRPVYEDVVASAKF